MNKIQLLSYVHFKLEQYGTVVSWSLFLWLFYA